MHCPVCISKLGLLVFAVVVYWIGTIVCIIPKSSEIYVVEMFPMLNNSYLGWLWLSSYLYIVISRLPFHLAVIFTCIGKHEYMVIVFNIYRSVKELRGGPCPCLSFSNRDHSWIFHLLCLQGNRLKIKGLLASTFSCVFFQLHKRSSSFVSWDFLIILLSAFIVLTSVIRLKFTWVIVCLCKLGSLYKVASQCFMSMWSKVWKYCKFDIR